MRVSDTWHILHLVIFLYHPSRNRNNGLFPQHDWHRSSGADHKEVKQLDVQPKKATPPLRKCDQYFNFSVMDTVIETGF